MLRIGIVAGEDSGDALGAALIEELKALSEDIEFVGVGGALMQQAGCKVLFPAERLAVMGIAEVARRFFEILGIRRQLVREFTSRRPDVFIGIDAPDFNLGLERKLKAAGIPTVHFVSPSIWAWRGWRRGRIARAADLLLTLFPFEAAIYASTPLQVCYVGHPLADKVALQPDRAAARRQLDLPAAAPIIALLPGSRRSEVGRLIEPFLDAARWCSRCRQDCRFVIAAANENVAQLIDAAVARRGQGLAIQVIVGAAHAIMTASNVVLLASGTAALEALLLKRPMLVTYRLGRGSYWVIRALARVPFLSLPNQLTEQPLVPEFFQDEVQPAIIGSHLMRLMDDREGTRLIEEEFSRVHQQLRCNAGARAARAVMDLIA